MIDRFHVAFLGAYGNSEIETPALNHLAADSFVADRYHADTPQLSMLYRSLWTGSHAGMEEAFLPENWVESLSRAGYQTVLLTDDIEIAYSPYRDGFAQVELIPEQTPEQTSEFPCEEREQTQLFRCFAQLCQVAEHLVALEKPYFLWCHFRAFGGIWDFPLAYREKYTGRDDPAPFSETVVPCFHEKDIIGEKAGEKDTTGEFADLRQSCSAAYSGGIQLLDELFEPFYLGLKEGAFGLETLFLLAGARGIPLGEHGQIGLSADEKEPLYSELVHLPLILRFPDGLAQTVRSDALMLPADLGGLVLEWLDLAPHEPKILPLIHEKLMSEKLTNEEASQLRDHIVMIGPDDESAVLTPSWFLRVPGHGNNPELYVKPDDRWEVNDVADRCDETVRQLTDLIVRRRREIELGLLETDEPLDPQLTERVD